MNLFKKPPVRKTGYGLKEMAPGPDDYVVGSANQALKVILSPERDFTKFLPVAEPQSNASFDSYSCVSFSALNNIEIIHKKQFGAEVNYSDRFLSSMSETVPGQGNGLAKVAETNRKSGLVLEEEYPFGGNSGFEYVKKPGQAVIDKGLAWLMSFDLQYEWVGWNGCNPMDLYNALQYGPLQVTADSVALRTGRIGKQIDHAVSAYKSVYKRSFSIFDQYEGFTYDVPWDFYFGSAMRYTLLKKKFLPLVMVFNRPEIYAIIGTTACHIVDEKSWNYGVAIGLWEKDPMTISSSTFNSSYPIGKSIAFK